MGIRILVPQWNADTIRIDFGVVIGGPPPSPDRIAASYGQITDLRPTQLRVGRRIAMAGHHDHLGLGHGRGDARRGRAPELGEHAHALSIARAAPRSHAGRTFE